MTALQEDLMAEVGEEVMGLMEARGLTVVEMMLVLASLNAIIAAGYEIGAREMYAGGKETH